MVLSTSHHSCWFDCLGSGLVWTRCRCLALRSLSRGSPFFPLLLRSRFQAETLAHGPCSPHGDQHLTSHLTLGLPCPRDLLGDLDCGWPWLLSPDLFCFPCSGTIGLRSCQWGHCPCPCLPCYDLAHFWNCQPFLYPTLILHLQWLTKILLMTAVNLGQRLTSPGLPFLTFSDFWRNSKGICVYKYRLWKLVPNHCTSVSYSSTQAYYLLLSALHKLSASYSLFPWTMQWIFLYCLWAPMPLRQRPFYMHLRNQKLSDKTESARKCQRSGIQSIWGIISWIQYVYYEVKRNASVQTTWFPINAWGSTAALQFWRC